MVPSNPRTGADADRALAARVVSLLQGDLDAPLDISALSLGVERDVPSVEAAVARVFGHGLEAVRDHLRAERDAASQGAALLRPEAPVPGPVSVHDAPAGLSLPPGVEGLGPFHGASVALASVGPVAVTRAL